jgi:putative ABC transport system permease protein
VKSKLRIRDIIGLGYQGILKRTARSVLTAAGIAIGIAAIVAVLGISASGRSDLLAALDSLGTNLLRVTEGPGILGQSSGFPDGAAEMAGRIGPVQQYSAATLVDDSVRRSDMVPELQTSGIGVFAAQETLLEVVGGTMREGRFLDEAADRLPVIVLGNVAAERLGVRSLEPRTRVYLGGTWFTVVGIADELPLHPDLERGAFIGATIANDLFDTPASPTSIYLRVNPDSINEVVDVLPSTISPENPDQVEIARPSDALAARRAAEEALTGLLVGLGAVALLVGGVAIANIMVMSVLERRMEIGVRRALGATRGHIRAQFLFESTLLASAGGIVGVLMGAGITVAFAINRDLTLAMPISGVLGSIGAALAVGSLAGLYPAIRAARIEPAEAVRTG